jgi:cytochrome c oxidase subunit I
MAIEIQPESMQQPGGREPSAAPKARPWWLRPAIHTALIGAIIGYLLGHLLGNAISSGYQQLPLADSNDTPIVLGYLFGILGWLIGLGVFNDTVRQMLGKPVTGAGEGHVGDDLAKYFRYSLDHKVVGIQYLFAMIGYFLTGGLFAMAIRAELLSPTYHLITPSAYLEVVGEHGTMMMMMMT